jgi:hypothetical protein
MQMHTTKVTNFAKPTSGQPFTTVEVQIGEDRQITTSMSKHGSSSVTFFFDNPADVIQLATNLHAQASTEELKCQTEKELK